MVVPWKLDLSLRGTAAQELHDAMVQLTGKGLIQLILAPMFFLGSGHSISPEAMRATLLIMVLGNDGNTYHLNSVLMAKLWSCCMNDQFNWQELGDWQMPLLTMLHRDSTMQWPDERNCLGPLLAP